MSLTSMQSASLLNALLLAASPVEIANWLNPTDALAPGAGGCPLPDATQPTVILYRELKDGSATKTAVATCTCPASATRQTVAAPSITNGDLDWATYRYFLEWDGLAGVIDGAAARGVEQVLVSFRTRAGL